METIIRRYPPLIGQLWRTAIDKLLQVENQPISMLTFGSLMTGDFTYTLYNDQLFLVSDFELVVLTEYTPAPSCQNDYLLAVRKFNAEFSRNHLGFHLNIKVEGYDRFASRLSSHPYFWNTLATSGMVVKENTGFLSPLNREIISVPVPVCCEVLNSIILNLLLQLDKRIINLTQLYPLYISMLVAKLVGKLARMLSCFQGNYASSVKNAMLSIRGKIPEKVFLSMVQAEEFRMLTSHPNHLDSILIGHALLVLDYLEHSTRNYWDNGIDLERFNLLYTLLSKLGLPLREEDAQERNQYEVKREAIVSAWLQGKEAHYDYYKQAYGIVS